MFVFEGNAKIRDFPGNYSIWKDYSEALERKRKATQKTGEQAVDKPSREKKPGLSYKEKQELLQLEKDLDSLEKEKSTIEASFNDNSLSPDKLIVNSERLGEIIKEINFKSERWIELSDLAT